MGRIGAVSFSCALPLAAALAIAWPAGAADRSAETLLIRVTVADRGRDIPRLQRLALDVAGSDAKSQTVDVIGDRATLAALRAAGLSAVIQRDLSPQPDSNPVADYLDPAEVNEQIDALVAAYPALARKMSYGTTAEGRPLNALKISDNVAVDEDEPSIFFIAQHHAREVMTPELALDIAGQLLGGYGTDPEITAWVNSREIFVLPNHNPDGSNWVFDRDRSWRKNRRDNGDHTFGVDLNRNYPFGWGSCNGSSPDTGSDGYRGPSPASEPETSGINALARLHRPVISLSYHTYGEQVLMPYGCGGVHAAEKAVFRRLASDIATRIVSDDGAHRYQPGAPWEILYSEDGETNAWFYGDNGTYAFEIEANDSTQGFQPHFTPWRDSTVQRNRPAWKYLLGRIDGPGISGHVTDACTGAPLSAVTSLDEIVFGNGETPRTSAPPYGRFQSLTNSGTFHLRTSLAGYTTQVGPVTVGVSRVDRPVRLVPAGANALAARETVVDDRSGDYDGQADAAESMTLRVVAVNAGSAAVSGVSAQLSTSDPFVTITKSTSAYGTIPAGLTAAGDGFTISLAAGAPDQHTAVLHVTFLAQQPLCGSSDDVPLTITTGRPGCVVLEPFDANPGWTITNSTSSGWAFGAPSGDGAAAGPAAAYSGANVYGTNLSGAYGNSADYRLVTVPYDLSKLRHGVLTYRRWLDNEPGFDLASVDVSNDAGGTWLPLWSGFGYGDGWESESIDISGAADLKPDVRFRFRLQSDAATARSGFYLDDFALCGEGLAKPPNGVGSTLRVTKAGPDLQFDWSAAAVDSGHDAASGYDLYRSGTSQTGYAAAGTSAGTSIVLAGEASAPSDSFYLVSAENFGGSSRDVPAP